MKLKNLKLFSSVCKGVTLFTNLKANFYKVIKTKKSDWRTNINKVTYCYTIMLHHIAARHSHVSVVQNVIQRENAVQILGLDASRLVISMSNYKLKPLCIFALYELQRGGFYEITIEKER